jgi:hypothetical protein
MPGGLGTLDVLTEVLTLIQTKKIKPFPVILYSSAYWAGFLAWLKATVLKNDMITAEDFDLLRVFDSPADIADAVQKWYQIQEVTGKKAI